MCRMYSGGADMADTYSIGIDFGTLSARAMIFRTSDGCLMGESVYAYPHGVMEEYLPDGTRLQGEYALQDPMDYLKALYHTIPSAVSSAGIPPAAISGIGVDFTSCSVLPITKAGIPLCFDENFRNNPNAYVKLWKHHGAKQYAKRINRAASNAERWVRACGGAVSPEWMLPKVLQIVEEAPEVASAADMILEAGDWIVYQLCGNLIRNAAAAGFVANWRPDTGYASLSVLDSVHPGFAAFVSQKLRGSVLAPGSFAGTLTQEMATRLNLPAGIPVAVAHMDAQSGFSALGVHEAGTMLAIMGTSTVYLVLDTEEKYVPGIGCVVKDGVIPGYFAYSAGQSCVGDGFAWVAKCCSSPEYQKEAASRGISMQELLSEKAQWQKPGQHGLIMLDWFNGNRSILLDMDLSACFMGITLHTRPEDLYRATIEASAFGARVIIENFQKHGVPVKRFCATGGIPVKNAMAMQIYADVLGMPVFVSSCTNGPALGAAILGAVAGGVYSSVAAASFHMGQINPVPYEPDPAAHATYTELYKEYTRLHDLFGRLKDPVMHHLKDIQRRALEKEQV